MRIRSTRSKIALLLPTALLLQITAVGSTAADLCDTIPGEWARFIGGKETCKGMMATPSITPATVPGTAPKKGLEGWTPIGPGGFGRQRALPIGPHGVPQRIGPQGRPPPKGAG